MLVDNRGGNAETHRGTKTTVDFENSELVEDGRVFWNWKIGIGDDLIICGGLDTLPVAAKWAVR
jgi:hypothetical protein